MRALAKKREDRYQSAKEMIAELQDVRAGLPYDPQLTRRLVPHSRTHSSLITLTDTLWRPRLSIFTILLLMGFTVLLTFILTNLLGQSISSASTNETLVTSIKYVASFSLLMLLFALAVSSINIGFKNIRIIITKLQFLRTRKHADYLEQIQRRDASTNPIENAATFFEAAGYTVRTKNQNDLQVIPGQPSDKENYGSSLVRLFETLPTIEEIQGFCNEALQVPGSPAYGFKPAFLVCPYLEPVHQLQAAIYQDMRLAVVPITYDWILEANARGEQRKNAKTPFATLTLLAFPEISTGEKMSLQL
jgi:hypothetical protein